MVTNRKIYIFLGLEYFMKFNKLMKILPFTSFFLFANPENSFSPEVSFKKIFNDDVNKTKSISLFEKILNEPVSDFYMPVSMGQISSLYGWRKNRKHSGIDIGVKENASIRSVGRPDILSAAPGIVKFVGHKSGYGKEIEIVHNGGLETRYAHLKKSFVKEGDSVLAQQIIGKMGNSGRIYSSKGGSGIHLHFEIRENGKPINPENKFKNYSDLKIDDVVFSYRNVLPEFEVIASNEKIKSNNKKDISDIVYSVQVGAFSNPLTKKEIKEFEKIYALKLKEIEFNKSGNILHKYLVGNFKDIKSAKKYGKDKNLEGKIGIAKYEQGNFSNLKWY